MTHLRHASAATTVLMPTSSAAPVRTRFWYPVDIQPEVMSHPDRSPSDQRFHHSTAHHSQRTSTKLSGAESRRQASYKLMGIDAPPPFLTMYSAAQLILAPTSVGHSVARSHRSVVSYRSVMVSPEMFNKLTHAILHTLVTYFKMLLTSEHVNISVVTSSSA